MIFYLYFYFKLKIMNKLFTELYERGLVKDLIPGTIEQFDTPTKAYVGFDPTADSLHVGSLLPIMVMKHIALHGHQVYGLVGGATGMIGDPSGKSDERNLLSMDVLEYNSNALGNQLSKLIGNKFSLVNNYDWFSKFSFLDFIRDVGKKITVNYMMSKDSVQTRINNGNGISFTEFTYQLIQGYDFKHLYDTLGVKVQFGGSDQWGNITTGTSLISKDGGEVYAFTIPLLMKSDGTKFGKSAGGNVWLDASKTSPYKFYQFWLNQNDEDSKKFIKMFTLLSLEEIEEVIKQHDAEPHKKIIQQVLAKEITVMIHGETEYNLVVNASKILFGSESVEKLSDNKILNVVKEAIPEIKISKNLKDSIVDLLVVSGIETSKTEARKSLKAGSIAINKQKIYENHTITDTDLFNNETIIIQRGKKKFNVITFE